MYLLLVASGYGVIQHSRSVAGDIIECPVEEQIVTFP
jgi:hypothetical protein